VVIVLVTLIIALLVSTVGIFWMHRYIFSLCYILRPITTLRQMAHDPIFWWPASGARNLGGELGSCVMDLILTVSIIWTYTMCRHGVVVTC